jgi:hypothetical protein
MTKHPRVRRSARRGIAAVSMATAMLGSLQIAGEPHAYALSYHPPSYCRIPGFTYSSECNDYYGDEYDEYDPWNDPNFYDPFDPANDPFNLPCYPLCFDPPPPPPDIPMTELFPPPELVPPAPLPEFSDPRSLALPLPVDRIRRPLLDHHRADDGSLRPAIDFGRGPDTEPSKGTQLPIGTPVYAVEGGRITYIDSSECGAGVQIDNGTHQWVYCHLSRRDFANRSVIEAGGQLGGSGNSGGVPPHLHVQVRTVVNGEKGPLLCPHPIFDALLNGQTPPTVESLVGGVCVAPTETTPQPTRGPRGGQIP